MKKVAPTYRPGDNELFQLFDIGEADHVRDLLADLFDPASEAQREAMSKTLLDLLGRPIEKLRERIFESGRGANASELDSLDRFALAVRLAALRLSNCRQLDEELAREYADDLHARWIGFIAYAGAFRMYHDMPRDLEDAAARAAAAIKQQDANKRRTAPMRDKRDALAYAARVDQSLVISRYAELVAAQARGKRKTVGAEFGLSQSTVKNIWNNRKK